jgi:hypothetical protein
VGGEMMYSPTIASRTLLLEKIKESEEELREKRKLSGLEIPAQTTINNTKSKFKDVKEEKEHRHEIIEEHLKIFRNILPELLKGLRKIKDPRNPKTLEHQLTCVLLYALLIFVFQMSSRREANRILTRPQFIKNLKALFPEIESLPHGDTVNRVLAQIEVEKIQDIQVKLIKDLIKNKKFRRYMIDHRYAIAIDGTQKFSREEPWSEESLEKTISTKKGEKTLYYVYVLEANLIFKNGMVIPLMTEILEVTKGDIEQDKQDCEIRAFKRLAKRIKKNFSHLPIRILLDGLYPNGPILNICRKYNWDYMIILKDKSLKTVWEEAYGLNKLETDNELETSWKGHKQHFWWINNIEYRYGNNGQYCIILNLVVCEETWEEVNKQTGEIEIKTSKYAWLSDVPISKKNVELRCNKIGRSRWYTEETNLVEKHHGYSYEHCFSEDWNAMKGFHYLMRLAHLLNTLVHYSIKIYEMIKECGVKGIIELLVSTLSAPWLEYERIGRFIAKTHQIRLI